MPHFVYNNTNLDFPKTDLNSLPVGADATQYVVAAEWNTTNQAIVDIKTLLRGAKYYGLEPQLTDPNPFGINNYLWLSNSGVLTLEYGVNTLQIAYANRAINAGTGLTGGGTLAADRTLALESISPSPAGTFLNPTITVDVHGRVTSAATGGDSTAQRFIYIRSGGNSSDFTVTLPAARPDTLYGVLAQLQGVGSAVLIDVPDDDKTTTEFRVITSADIINGDKIYFVVNPLT